MANLPYFKFTVNDWITGDITSEDYAVQGLFINLCAYYWSKNCDVTFRKVYKHFKGEEKGLNTLIIEGLINNPENNPAQNLTIKFLDNQITQRKSKADTSRKNGKKGGRPKHEKTQKEPSGLLPDNPVGLLPVTQSEPTRTQLREEEIREEKKRQEQIRLDCVTKGTNPTIKDVELFCQSQGLPIDSKKFFFHYEALGWRVSGQPVLNWQALAGKWNTIQHDPRFKSSSKPAFTPLDDSPGTVAF